MRAGSVARGRSETSSERVSAHSASPRGGEDGRKPEERPGYAAARHRFS